MVGDFCCSNFQMGCPHTTLSPLGCDARNPEAQLVISLHLDHRKDLKNQFIHHIGFFHPIDHHFPHLLGHRFWCPHSWTNAIDQMYP